MRDGLCHPVTEATDGQYHLLMTKAVPVAEVMVVEPRDAGYCICLMDMSGNERWLNDEPVPDVVSGKIRPC